MLLTHTASINGEQRNYELVISQDWFERLEQSGVEYPSEAFLGYHLLNYQIPWDEPYQHPNYIIEYFEDAAEGSYYPLKITYTKGNNLIKYRTINFYYENRNDHAPKYAPTKFVIDKRLKWITVKVDMYLARKYCLQYNQDSTTNRSLLIKIQEYGSDGNEPNYIASGSPLVDPD